MKWLLLTLALFAIGILSYFVMRGPSIDNHGWPGVKDPSVMAYPLQQTAGATVENGDAFDKTSIDVTPYKKIVVPENAEVQTQGKEPRLQIYMKKTLGFGGHPPEPMSIYTARKKMGCAVQVEGNDLLLATFGEWASKEGGATMHLLLIVPDGLEFEKRSGLTGLESAGNKSNWALLTKPKEPKEGYWYGPEAPGEGWKAVPDVADRERKAHD
jgi:hypothetical protein